MATSGPALYEYLDAAFLASFDPLDQSPSPSQPAPQPLKGVDGQPVMSTIDDDGFSAQAFLTSENQLIVAYAGTDFKDLLSNPKFVTSQIADDYLIYLGINPPAFADGLDFLSKAESAAAAMGISTAAGNVFVDGHSLGGAIAAYVAAQDGLPGTTFAAPGLAPGDIPPGADPGEVEAYVEYGDPIGNYGNNKNYEGTFLHDQGILRYGTTSYIGSFLARGELLAAAALYAGNKDDGLAAFAAAAVAHHALTNYAADLDIDPSAIPPGGPDITVLQLVTAVQQIIAKGNLTRLSVSLDPDVSFTNPTTAVLTGTASSLVGIQSVEITADVDGVSTDLGAATLGPDGTFSFTDPVGSHAQSEITATATDAIGNVASQTAHVLLEDGTATPLFGASAPDQPSAGQTIEVTAPGQTLTSDHYDIFDNHHQKNTAFVFDPGFGIDVVKGFTVSGPGRDLLALPLSDFQNLAAVLRNTGDVNGSAFITDPKTGDAIRIAGVTTAQLKANPKDFILV